MPSMKVHQFRSGLLQQEPSLTLTVLPAGAASAFNRIRSLPRNNLRNHPRKVVRPLDLKSFIKHDNAGSRKATQADHHAASAQPAGGTRWNPTQEQIGILEMLYRGGMRTPNTEQIQEITGQLVNYGKIEGKNVFYWFQNHKARERQKIKRKKTLSCFISSHSPTSFATTNSPDASSTSTGYEERETGDSHHQYYYKRKCRSWSTDNDHGFELLEDNRRLYVEEEEEDKIITLELFPLHPEGRS